MERVISGIVLDDAVSLTLGELCRCCGVNAEFVIELVDEGVLSPEGARPAQWRFRGIQVKRVQRAVRLSDDLRVNLPGVALALELMDELEQLRQQSLRSRLLENDGDTP